MSLRGSSTRYVYKNTISSRNQPAGTATEIILQQVLDDLNVVEMLNIKVLPTILNW